MKYFLILTLAGLILTQIALGAGYELSVPIPTPQGKVTTITDPAQYIQTIFRFLIGAGALLAIGTIVFAGIVYIVQQGNIAKQLDAKDMILNAVWGLALLMGSVLILTTINPRLTKLSLPKLENVEIKRETSALWDKFSVALQKNREAVANQNEKTEDIVKFMQDEGIDPSFLTNPDAPIKGEFYWQTLKERRNLTDAQLKELRLKFAQLSYEYHKAAEERHKTNVGQQNTNLELHLSKQPKPDIVDSLLSKGGAFTAPFRGAKKYVDYVTESDAASQWSNTRKSIEEALANLNSQTAGFEENAAKAKAALDQLSR